MTDLEARVLALHRADALGAPAIAARLGEPLAAVRQAMRALGLRAKPGPKGTAKARAVRVSLWLSPEQVDLLERAAGGEPLASWCRQVVIAAAEGRGGPNGGGF